MSERDNEKMYVETTWGERKCWTRCGGWNVKRKCCTMKTGGDTGSIQCWCWSWCQNWSCTENNLSCVKTNLQVCSRDCPILMRYETVIDVILDQTIMVITMEWFGKIMVIYHAPTRGENLPAQLGFGLVWALFCIHNEQNCHPYFIYISTLQTGTIKS